jgi:hypothetical protein
MTATYATPTAFRQALEMRLHTLAQREGTDLQRLRRQVAFDRLLCRLFQDCDCPWVLKGGYAMELRLSESRTTRDIDLGTRHPVKGSGKLAERILTVLQDAAATDLGDFFTFLIGQPVQDLDAAPYGGARYPVEVRMDGRLFIRFHLDVASGDAVIEPCEQVRGRDWLGFAGIPACAFPAIPKEQQLAEKLHAYTLPRGDVTNSRVRDLLDMVILIRLGLDVDKTRTALARTFEKRATHPPPIALTPPPENWARPFAALAMECSLSLDSRAAFDIVAAYYTSLRSE